MSHPFNLKMPSGFTFKPVIPKQHKTSSSHKPLTTILYCVAKKDEDGNWKAHVNTKGLNGYEDLTILPFTEKSFNLKNRTDVFRTKKDNKNHWVRIIRNEIDAMVSMDTIQGICSVCENCVFSGHIVKINNEKQFDMSVYQGTIKQCENLLTMRNVNKKEE